jgi:hypothetical protein
LCSTRIVTELLPHNHRIYRNFFTYIRQAQMISPARLKTKATTSQPAPATPTPKKLLPLPRHSIVVQYFPSGKSFSVPSATPPAARAGYGGGRLAPCFAVPAPPIACYISYCLVPCPPHWCPVRVVSFTVVSSISLRHALFRLL